MTPNNNLSILPFYTALGDQNHRKDYAFGAVHPLITPEKSLLPFQIIRDTRNAVVTSVLLKNFDGSTFADITSDMLSGGLTVVRYASLGYDVIVYPCTSLFSTATPEGQYYAELTDGTQTWYSEVFTIVKNLSNYLKIEYYDMYNLTFDGGCIDYTTSFKNVAYLCTQLGMPDYSFEEEVEKRDGFQFIEKQISEKVYKFNFIAPEYLCDALRLVRMSDYITVTSKGKTYNVDSFLITPKWQDGGLYAAVEAEFECNTIVKKVGKGVMSYFPTTTTTVIAPTTTTTIAPTTTTHAPTTTTTYSGPTTTLTPTTTTTLTPTTTVTPTTTTTLVPTTTTTLAPTTTVTPTTTTTLTPTTTTTQAPTTTTQTPTTTTTQTPATTTTAYPRNEYTYVGYGLTKNNAFEDNTTGSFWSVGLYAPAYTTQYGSTLAEDGYYCTTRGADVPSSVFAQISSGNYMSDNA